MKHHSGGVRVRPRAFSNRANSGFVSVSNSPKDFLDEISAACERDEIVKGTNNQAGAVRKLTIKDGPSFTEELLAFDEGTHSYRYRIVESPLPIQV